MKPVNVWDRLAAHIPTQRNAQRFGEPYIPPDCAHLLSRDEREFVDDLIRRLVR